ncbi:hypothetical protein NE237_017925 [Protea cynaroides]|uniref:Uncharacterized protein n=1 Tax=Protea cynaroides TaxID=273540 RepID=A0A9Q0K923_9MAGN|nr:hypothetical protein NE237_017925 [Protea cynaroides]
MLIASSLGLPAVGSSAVNPGCVPRCDGQIVDCRSEIDSRGRTQGYNGCKHRRVDEVQIPLHIPSCNIGPSRSLSAAPLHNAGYVTGSSSQGVATCSFADVAKVIVNVEEDVGDADKSNEEDEVSLEAASEEDYPAVDIATGSHAVSTPPWASQVQMGTSLEEFNKVEIVNKMLQKGKEPITDVKPKGETYQNIGQEER